MTRPFDIRLRIESFRFAARGLAGLIVHEHNARIHLLATAAVTGLAAWLGLPAQSWGLLGLAIGLVWVAEALNTAIEALADATHPDPDPLIGRAKDVAAGGVLIAAIAAVFVGLLVLGPPLWAWVMP